MAVSRFAAVGERKATPETRVDTSKELFENKSKLMSFLIENNVVFKEVAADK